MRELRKSGKIACSLVGMLIVGLLISGCIPVASAQEKKATVSFWTPFPVPFYEPWASWVTDTFNKLHPQIKLETTPIPWDRIEDKLLPAIAAGNPPDVFQWRRPVFQSAAMGHAQPLDEFIKNDPLVNPDDWYPSVWYDVTYEGHVYALPFESDSLVFFWNKDYYKEAGLDPERPPKYLSELDVYAEKLTKENPQGEYDVLGFNPWAGRSIEFMHWGWKNGGKFYDPETGRITATDPRNVEMLKWEVEFAKKYGPEKMGVLVEAAATAGPGGESVGMFSMGLTAMRVAGSYFWSRVDKYGPDVDYGMTRYVPIPKGGQNAGITEGTIIYMPTGAKGIREYPEAVWKFMRWYSINAMPVWCLQVGDLVSRPEYADLWMFASNPKVEECTKAIELTHPWPKVPALWFYRDQLQQAVQYAVYGKKTPEQALKDVENAVQREMERYK